MLQRLKVSQSMWFEPRKKDGASLKMNLMLFDSGCHSLIEMTLVSSKYSKYELKW